MIMLSFLRNRSVIARQAENIVGLVCESFPLSEQRRLTDPRLKKQAATAVRKIARAARTLAQEHHVGMVGKAYVANKVQWGLIERGYGKDFVESVTTSLVVSMGS